MMIRVGKILVESAELRDEIVRCRQDIRRGLREHKELVRLLSEAIAKARSIYDATVSAGG